MAEINVAVPSLVQGISQQPDGLKFPSQAALQENAYPSITDGLMKRHPFEAVGRMQTGGNAAPLVHLINRDIQERYQVLLSHRRAQVFELDGTELQVLGPMGSPDFSYLDLTPTDALEGDTTFTSADHWGTTGDVLPAVTSSELSPIGLGFAAELSSTIFGTIDGDYLSPVVPALTFAPVSTVSCYFKEGTASTFGLGLLNNSSAFLHAAYFLWVDGVPLVDRVHGGITAQVEKMPSDWWRISVSLRVGSFGSDITAVGDGLQVALLINDFGSTPRTVNAWGARVDFALAATPVRLPGTPNLKAVTIADYTLVLSSLVTASMDPAALSPADPSARKAFLFVRASGYKENYNVKIQRSGDTLQTIQQSTWDGTAAVAVKDIYTFRILTVGTVGQPWTWTALGSTATHTVTGGDSVNSVASAMQIAINALPNMSATFTSPDTVVVTGDYEGQLLGPTVGPASTGTFTNTHSQTASSTEGNTIKTDDIATQLATKLNALTGYTSSAVGSVVVIDTTTDLTLLDVSDSFGDNNLVRVWRTVKTPTELPLTCQDDFKVQVVGETSDTGDDYFIRFEADAGSGFGNGRWVESNGHAIETTLDATTMPYKLTRMQDDNLGTLTGLPFGKYFLWDVVEWNTRDVGDDNSSPVPSLVGQTLSDVAFFRGRLVLTAGQNVVLSEVDRFFNFFRTTVLQLPDSDPIDVSVPHTSVVNLHDAVPFHKQLVLFSDLPIFVLSGSPVLSPKTVTAPPVLEYENLRGCRPLQTERGMFFAAKRGEFSAVWEMMPSQTAADVDDFVAEPVTAAVPKYIEGRAVQMAASSLENVLFILADGDPTKLFVYNYFTQGGQQEQAAWHTYQIGGSVLGLNFIESDLYLIVQHDADVWLEKATIAAGRVDPDSTYITHLDRRYRAGPDTAHPGTYDAGTGETTWDLLYDLDEYTTAMVVTTSGEVLSATPATGTISVPGDYSAAEVWIGVPYLMRYRFSIATLKTQTQGRGGAGAVATIKAGFYKLRRGSVTFARTAYFKILTQILNRDPSYSEYGSATSAPDEIVGSLALEDGTFRFGIHSTASEAIIEIQNDSPLPSNFESAEWEASYNSKTQRFQG